MRKIFAKRGEKKDGKGGGLDKRLERSKGQ